MLSEINDGYGDPVSRDAQLRQLVGDYKGWITSMVHGLAYSTPWRHEDLVQEAYIAMWKGLDEWNGHGHLEGYLRQRARWRVKSLCYGEGRRRELGNESNRTTGSSQRRGDETRNRIKSYLREYARVNGTAPSMAEAGRALDMSPSAVGKQMRKLGTIEITENMSLMVQAYRTTSLDLLSELGFEPLSFAEKISEMELSYHYGEIHKAVSELSPEWREYVWLRFWGGLTDSQATRSVTEVTKDTWSRRIKPELAEQLAHLATAY